MRGPADIASPQSGQIRHGVDDRMLARLIVVGGTGLWLAVRSVARTRIQWQR
jgi:hypothetical protein